MNVRRSVPNAKTITATRARTNPACPLDLPQRIRTIGGENPPSADGGGSCRAPHAQPSESPMEALEHYVREGEIEEQQGRLDFLKRYYGYFGFGEPHREIQQAQERVNAMQQRQDSRPKEQSTPSLSVEAALYHITITDSGRLECTPHWLLSMEETAQLLGIGRTLLWELSKQDDFPVFHIQRRAFVRVESLLAWIRLKEHPEAEPPTSVIASPKRKQAPKTETKRRRTT
jgi:predicted DNA-binding transcriptional regulator AlpA